jgi:PAS domain S-box-containing protein
MSTTLTEGPRFLRGILGSVGTGVVVVDESGTVVLANDAAGDLVGRSTAELSERPVGDLFADRHGAPMETVREVARAGGATGADGTAVSLVDADGDRIPVRLEAEPTEHEGERYVTLSLVERAAGGRERRGTEELGGTGTGSRTETGTGSRTETGTGSRTETGTGSRTEARPGTGTGELLRGVFEASNDGLFVVDPAADRILDCNGRACELLACGRDELLSRRPSEVLPHDPETLVDFAGTGRRVTGELGCCTDDDARPTAEITLSLLTVGRDRRVLVHLRDVTERRERVARLRRRSEAMDAAFDGIAILDEDREFVYVNRAHAAIHGYEASAELVGEPWEQCYGPEAARRLRWDVLPTVREDGRWRGEATGQRADGSEFPQELSISRLDGGGCVCVVRDASEHRRRTRGLELLNEASRELSRATTAERIARIATRTAERLLGTDVVCVRLFDPETGSLEPAATSDAASELVESRLAFDLGATLAGRAYRRGEPVVDRPQPDDPFVEEPHRGSLHLPLGEHGTLTVFTEPDEALSETDRRLATTLAETVAADLERADRERELRESERTIRQQHERLASLNRVNELVQDIVGELIDAPTREELERRVCERLAATDRYRAAWLAEADVNGTPRGLAASAGLTGDDRTRIERLPLEQVEDGVVTRAAETGEFSVIRNYRADGASAAAGVEEGARVESTAAVPLRYGDRLYGVLVLTADDPDAFDGAVESGLAVLGDTIGFAVHAVENRRLLLSDEVVELEFEVTDERCLAVAVSEALGCEAAIEQAVLTRAGNHLCYLKVEGADPESAAAATADAPAVARCRVVRETDDGCLLEATKTESGAEAMMDVGATIRTATADDGVGTLVVEAPPSANVREVVDHYAARNPESRLVAKRERDRSAGTTAAVRERLDERLTDKQESALTAAYYAGYYDWPRGSTAQELADSLGVASATLHQHLRAAERKLLAAVLDD